jgi:hypothetical protein
MQNIIRKFISEERLQQVVYKVTTSERNWLCLDHGEGWTEDVTKEQEEHLKTLNINVYEDWPRGINGHSVDGFIVELCYTKQ